MKLHHTPERQRGYHLKCLYGLTMEQYNAKIAEQDGKCAICGTEFVIGFFGRGKALVPHVDHDHDTGAVRSLLCGNCNRQVGQYETSDIAAISRYVARHKCLS